MQNSKIAVALLLLASTAAFGEPPPGPPPGGAPVEALARDLGLDAAQKTEVKRIFEEHRAQLEAQRAQNDSRMLEQLSAVLSAEQLEKFESLRQKQRPPGPPPRE